MPGLIPKHQCPKQKNNKHNLFGAELLFHDPLIHDCDHHHCSATRMPIGETGTDAYCMHGSHQRQDSSRRQDSGSQYSDLSPSLLHRNQNIEQPVSLSDHPAENLIDRLGLFHPGLNKSIGQVFDVAIDQLSKVLDLCGISFIDHFQ